MYVSVKSVGKSGEKNNNKTGIPGDKIHLNLNIYGGS